MDGKSTLKHIGKVVLAVVCAVLLFYAFMVASVGLLFQHTDYSGLWILIFGIIAILVEITVIAALFGFIKEKGFYIPVCILFAICLIPSVSFFAYQNYIDNIPTIGEANTRTFIADYAPYAEDTKTVMLDETSTLIIEENLPVMDGATALYPIYSSFAKAVYPKQYIDDIRNNHLNCSTTTQAYRNIVTGDADIIFAALPSEEQKQFAVENGVELVYTPIGKEAFVFFVNAKNPLEDITVEQIQKVYSGQVTQWEDLGVHGFGEIKAFQRDKGSGSQSTLEKLMAEHTLVTPQTEDVIDGMGGIIEKTASYKNYNNAIGYSFRYFSTEMVNN
ncbi:MAG: PstS family phosphate ABC transporter substrate-binding protein, partial [Clostridia bacterium]|nr:PstS family phosphate ABC transporter substrate-binding protein [Clostridia bacterium]